MRKLLALLLCVLLLTGVFTACGQKVPEKTDDGRIIVRFMVGGSAGELEGYQAAVDAFNEQSTTTFVEMNGLPGDGYNEKVITQLGSNNPPDVFYSDEGSFGELTNSERLLDLTAYLDAGAHGLTRSDIPESLQHFASRGDALYGVPVDCNPMVLYYNTELFSQLGIRSPQEYYDNDEWTFASLQEVSEQLRDGGFVGLVYENWWGPMYSMLLSRDTKIYADDGKTSNFDDPRMLAGMEYLNSNVQSGAFTFTRNSANATTESPDQLFMAGQSGMIFAGRWFVPDFKEISFAWDVVPFPYYKEPGDSIVPMPSTPLVINKAAKHPDNAWEFISFYCGQPGQRVRMEGQGNAVPTVPGLDEIVLEAGIPPHAQYFLDAVGNSFSYPREEATHPGLTDKLILEVEKMLIGEQDPAATLANMKTVADGQLAE